MRRDVFVPARGQYDNIGDILLRRQLLDWVRPSGRLHVYVGESPDGYDDGLKLQPDDIRYRSFGKWYLAALASAARGRACYVFKPGEIQLTLVGMKEHLSMLPVLSLVRLRGGANARVGVGSRNFAPVPRALMWPSIRLSDISLWRDAATDAYLGHGSVMPDLAFAEGEGADSDAAGRDRLVVSMRSDRAYPSAEWIAAVRTTAANHGWGITAVTQVLRDDARSAQLARDLGGTVLGWDGTGHRAQEERLRELYGRTALVVSDRLHVLIGALTEGAVPAALLVDRSDKIERHFAAAGIEGISIATSGLSSAELVSRLETIIGRRQEIMTALGDARSRLAVHRDRVAAVLTGRR